MILGTLHLQGVRHLVRSAPVMPVADRDFPAGEGASAAPQIHGILFRVLNTKRYIKMATDHTDFTDAKTLWKKTLRRSTIVGGGTRLDRSTVLPSNGQLAEAVDS